MCIKFNNHKQSFQKAACHMTCMDTNQVFFFFFCSFSPKWKNFFWQPPINYFKGVSSPFFPPRWPTILLLIRKLVKMFEIWGVWPNSKFDFFKIKNVFQESWFYFQCFLVYISQLQWRYGVRPGENVVVLENYKADKKQSPSNTVLKLCLVWNIWVGVGKLRFMPQS